MGKRYRLKIIYYYMSFPMRYLLIIDYHAVKFKVKKTGGY